MCIKIAITGPESTGKSELTRNLAKHYRTNWVPEFAREYINRLNRPYNYSDLLVIAKGQKNSEDHTAGKCSKYLFCDTELTVIKIWSEFKYGKCHQWILDNIEKQTHRLYLLTDIDLPWQPDSQREHPDKRDLLFNLFVSALEHGKVPYRIISGLGSDRLLNAIHSIESFF
jgi:NadR type nicotinamide-nucleotide adenylyltransferase